MLHLTPANGLLNEQLTTRLIAFATIPPSPRKARKTGGYFTPHRDAFGRSIARSIAKRIDVQNLFQLVEKHKCKSGTFSNGTRRQRGQAAAKAGHSTETPQLRALCWTDRIGRTPAPAGSSRT